MPLTSANAVITAAKEEEDEDARAEDEEEEKGAEEDEEDEVGVSRTDRQCRNNGSASW